LKRGCQAVRARQLSAMARKTDWEAMDGPSLRKIMQDWPSVMRQATDPWAQDFARDVWKRSGDGQWRPTLKQARIMRKMIRQLTDLSGDDPILIE
jgi:hypothetical protein